VRSFPSRFLCPSSLSYLPCFFRDYPKIQASRQKTKLSSSSVDLFALYLVLKDLKKGNFINHKATFYKRKNYFFTFSSYLPLHRRLPYRPFLKLPFSTTHQWKRRFQQESDEKQHRIVRTHPFISSQSIENLPSPFSTNSLPSFLSAN
jgi:hypothetical protein